MVGGASEIVTANCGGPSIIIVVRQSIGIGSWQPPALPAGGG